MNLCVFSVGSGVKLTIHHPATGLSDDSRDLSARLDLKQLEQNLSVFSASSVVNSYIMEALCDPVSSGVKLRIHHCAADLSKN